ncbi:lysozyme inhibitor LprI family protein [Pseudomonas sp. PDM20]|uniref:lysozyme inhibitor LprI family protein n=1 Tax=Pseudomonas sp. PDM20 TaxID=2769254 RepID=UPI001CE0C7D4
MVVHACADDISRRVNAEMVQKLKSLRKAYVEEAPQDVERLDESQRFWESYRDMQCELSGVHIGSPMYSVCPMEKAIQRLKEINYLLQQ